MRRLVACCDGTWKTPSDDTNVARLARALAADDAQLVRYFPGAGTDGAPWRRVIDAAIGAGLAEGVQEVYAWLAVTWRPGDEIVLFGFSRGAYTVRSLTGMLADCGLAVPPDGDPESPATAALARRVWDEGYRGQRRLDDVATHPGFGPDDRAPIAFLGVWDTVGALGVPRTFGLLSDVLGRGDVRFRDLVLTPDVRHARHALALDERRGPYLPAPWPDPAPGTHDSVDQRWFPGGHGDVGGGDGPRGLADGALRWMADEVTAAIGLRWQDPVTVTGDPRAPLDDGATGVWRYLTPRPRSVPRVTDGAATVHASAVARRAAGLVPGYRTGTVPAVGEDHDVAVPADQPWHETGLYLEPGRYRLRAAGSWRELGAAIPASGAASWPVRTWPLYGAGTVLDGVRALVRRVTGNPRSDVVGSRRVPDARWLELVLVVADDRLAPDGSLVEGTTAAVGPDAQRDLDVSSGGYLYAFANDAWTGYGTNSGAVTCTVTRLT